MTKDRKYKTEPGKNKVREPETAFKSFRVFSSFEEMEQDELKWLASLTPEQHLRHTVDLIKRVFADKLAQNPKIGKKLYFD